MVSVVIEIVEQVKQKLSWEEAIVSGQEARLSEDSGRWTLGDLAGEVEKTYGEDSVGKYAYAVGVAKKTLMGYRSVAKRFIPEIRERYKKLSFSHFKTIASLEKPEAWLEKADDNDWSVEKLSIEVSKAYEGLKEPKLEDKPPKVYRCPECNLWRLEDISYHDICKGHYVITKTGMEFK
jgi:hypothetical protein